MNQRGRNLEILIARQDICSHGVDQQSKEFMFFMKQKGAGKIALGKKGSRCVQRCFVKHTTFFSEKRVEVIKLIASMCPNSTS